MFITIFMQFWDPQILCIFDTQNLWISIFKLCFRFICWWGVALSIWDFSNMFWSYFSLKSMHYFCVFSFVGVILWKFSFSEKSMSSVYVVIYISLMSFYGLESSSIEFFGTWRIFWIPSLTLSSYPWRYGQNSLNCCLKTSFVAENHMYCAPFDCRKHENDFEYLDR